MVTTQEFIDRCVVKHGDTYDYSKVEYKKMHSKVEIICPIHGSFFSEANSHVRGRGCGKCKGYNKTTEEFIKQCRLVHGNKYDYSKVDYVNAFDKIVIKCKKHGEFKQSPTNHIHNKRGCPECKIYNRNKNTLDIRKDSFIQSSKNIHGDKYKYDLVDYENNHKNVEIVCRKHGSFFQMPSNHLKGCECPSCASSSFISIQEKELNKFLKDNGVKTKTTFRKFEDIGEIDILCPEEKICIECNGIYWHSELFKDKEYHINKTKQCNKLGYDLIHVFEDEWRDKQDICKSLILNKLNKTSEKIYARNCTIQEIEAKVANTFMEENHIKGSCVDKIRIGLYHKEEVVCVMTFGKRRKNLGASSIKGEYELIRLCSKINVQVVGGASRLLKYFEKTYNPKKIVSYCDLRWFNGKGYIKMGFKEIYRTQPNYYYVKGGKRYNRFKFRKSELPKLLDSFDSDKTEKENMIDSGYLRIYDCGSIKFEKQY